MITNADTEVIIDALEAARHALTICDGSVATDRPDLVDAESKNMFWRIDNADEVRRIDAGLNILARLTEQGRQASRATKGIAEGK
jgi:hypothetical protein